MDDIATDEKLFFDRHANVYPLYELFRQRLLAAYPDTLVKVQKTQISFYNRHLYACASFLRVKRKTELPEVYTRLDSSRVAAIAEPYPGRWTTHFVISDPSDLDAVMYGWIDQAYEFANPK